MLRITTLEPSLSSKLRMSSVISPSVQPGDQDDSISITTQQNTASTESHSESSISDLAEITKKLLSLGSTLLSTFSDPTTDYDAFQPPTVPSTQVEEEVELQDDEEIIQGLNATSAHQLQNTSVAKLNRAAQRAFGTSLHYLNFDFVEDQGPRRKKCILTITKPDGQKRVYTTEPVFARKGEAKAKVASIAIQHDALRFISGGDPNTSAVHNLCLVNAPEKDRGKKPPISATAGNGSNESVAAADEKLLVNQLETAKEIDEIQNCCKEWRADHVQPEFVTTTDPKTGLHGCALRLCLTPHLKRVYSVRTACQDRDDAKMAVAKEAVKQGLLNFIQHGDGQQEPTPSAAEYAPPEYVKDGASDTTLPAGRRIPDKAAKEKEMTKIQTINTFWDALPKPLPAPGVGIGSGDLVDPKSWVNQMLQQNKGCQLVLSFSWSMDGRSGLHGCVLRLDHPSLPSRSYMVDAVFSKRQEAKTAVCLQAISEDVGEYIRSTGIKYNESMTKEIKEQATKLYTVITQDLSRLRPSQRAEWEFICESQVFGCNLTIPLDDGITKRTYKTKLEYRSRGDAKAAVALMAVNQGALEFIRFRGKLPPADYNRDTFDWKVHLAKKAAETAEVKRAADAAARFAAEEKKRQAMADRHAAIEATRRERLENEAKRKMMSQKRKREYDDRSEFSTPRASLSDVGAADGYGGENKFKRQRQGFDPNRMSTDAEFRGPNPFGWKPRYGHGLSSLSTAYGYQHRGFDPQAMRRGQDGPYGYAPYPRPSDRDVSQDGYAWTPDQTYPKGHYNQRPPRPPFPHRRGTHNNWDMQGVDELGRDLDRSAVLSMIAESRSDQHPVPPTEEYRSPNSFAEPGPKRQQPDFPQHHNYHPPPDTQNYPSHLPDSRPDTQGYPQLSDVDHPMASEQDALDEIYAAHPHPPRQSPKRPNLSSQASRSYHDLDAAISNDPYHDSLYGSPDPAVNTPASGDPYAMSTHASDPESVAMRNFPERMAISPDSVYGGGTNDDKSNNPDAQPTDANKDAQSTTFFDLSRGQKHPSAFEFDDDSIPFSSSATRSPGEVSQEPPTPPAAAATSPPEPTEQMRPGGKSYMTQLFDLCDEAGKPRPVFYSNAVHTEKGIQYSIWIVLGKERLELPVTFPNLCTGQEKLSKQVLARLRKTLEKDN